MHILKMMILSMRSKAEKRRSVYIPEKRKSGQILLVVVQNRKQDNISKNLLIEPGHLSQRCFMITGVEMVLESWSMVILPSDAVNTNQ